MELRRGGNSFDWFFMAMLRWQLGEKTAAAKWYNLALRWMQEHNSKPGVRFGDDQYRYEDLLRIGSEAAALLGLPEPSPSREGQGQADELEIANLILEADPSAAWAHQHRGSTYVAMRQWDQADADFAKAIELEPENPARWSSRAGLHAQQAKWDSAIAGFSQAIELNPNDPYLWYQRALARLAVAQTEECRQDCAQMLQRFAQADKPDEARWVAWTCAILSDAVADWPAVAALGEKAARLHPRCVSCMTTSGAALHRAGRFEEALARLTEAERLVTDSSQSQEPPPAYTWFFLALAHHRLGQADQARRWLDKAVEWMDTAGQEQAEAAATRPPMPWNRRLTLKLLREEAEALLKSSPASAPGSEKPKAAPPAKEKAN